MIIISRQRFQPQRTHRDYFRVEAEALSCFAVFVATARRAGLVRCLTAPEGSARRRAHARPGVRTI
ncbi:MAG TPA: hypothetical protein PKK68_01825 [Methanothrix soehngenii]|nr:hypothetical protein [Methanothrix soehngenii]